MQVREVPVPLNIFEICHLELAVNAAIRGGIIDSEIGKDLITKLTRAGEIVLRRENKVLKFTY